MTDRGRNIVAALGPTVIRLSCVAHLLNNVLEHVFDEKKFGGDDSPLFCVLETLRRCRELVAYFKRSGLMEKLDTSLKQTVNTRWNTHLILFESVDKNYEKIEQVSLFIEIAHLSCFI